VGVTLTVDKHAPGYLLLVGALLLPSVVFAYAMKDVAATITMDDVGFSAITAGLRRRSGDWSEVTAEHTEAWGGRYGPYVSLRHNIVKSKVGLRKTTGTYDDAMRFAIAHSANRIPFEAALKQRQARRRARTCRES
jgi:hypothetical protein